MQVGPRAPKTLNGKPLLAECPGALASWITAFKAKNKDKFDKFDAVLARLLARCGASENGQHLIDEASFEWSWVCGSVQFMTSHSRGDNKHIDGGAGCLHFSITLRGCRTLRFFSASEEVSDLNLAPGFCYFGNVAAIQHQVLHNGLDASTNCFQEIAVQLRAKAFRHTRATSMAIGPNPKDVWQAFCESSERELCSQWLMPTMDDLRER